MNKVSRIVIIDSEETTCSLQKLVLEKYDSTLKIEIITSGNQALEFFMRNYVAGANPQQDIDLILLEVFIVGIDGYQLLDTLSEMKGIDPSRFEIIVLTRSPWKADMRKADAYKHIIYDYLLKPLLPETLKLILAGINEKGGVCTGVALARE